MENIWVMANNNIMEDRKIALTADPLQDVLLSSL